MNCWVRPSGTDGSVGVNWSETSAAGLTVSVVAPWIPVAESTARTVVEPTASAAASPAPGPAPVIDATLGALDVQSTVAVRS